MSVKMAQVPTEDQFKVIPTNNGLFVGKLVDES